MATPGISYEVENPKIEEKTDARSLDEHWCATDHLAMIPKDLQFPYHREPWNVDGNVSVFFPNIPKELEIVSENWLLVMRSHLVHVYVPTEIILTILHAFERLIFFSFRFDSALACWFEDWIKIRRCSFSH